MDLRAVLFMNEVQGACMVESTGMASGMGRSWLWGCLVSRGLFTPEKGVEVGWESGIGMGEWDDFGGPCPGPDGYLNSEIMGQGRK